MSSTPENDAKPKNRFWKWFRLREGRTIYRTSFTVHHKDGTPCTVTVEGAHAEYVAALANGMKARYTPSERPSETLDESLRRMQRAGI